MSSPSEITDKPNYKTLQREAEKRTRQCKVPREGATRWVDGKGQRYERLKNGQIVRVS